MIPTMLTNPVYAVEHKNKNHSFRCYAASKDDICAAVTTNETYPSRIALECVLTALKAFKQDHPSLPASRTYEVRVRRCMHRMR